MAEQTDLRKLLVVPSPALQAAGVIQALRDHFDVTIAEGFTEAADELVKGRFDVVLAETADFLPLERGLVVQQAHVVLDTIGDGICVVGPRGELAWANRRIRGFSTDMLEALRGLCRQAYEQFASSSQQIRERGKRFHLPGEGNTSYEVICSPVRDKQGILQQVVAVVVDVTSQRRQQLKLNAIDRAGRELVRLDDDMSAGRTAPERLKLLEDRLIRYSRDVLDYQHFAVLLAEPRSQRLSVVISQGLDLEAEKIELLVRTEGSGICGYVAATGRSYICPDVEKDPRYLPGLTGARSSLTVPLRLHDRVIGVLNVESDRLSAFGEEDRQFAEIFANYIAVALHMLNLLAYERCTAHNQASGSMAAELSGPLNDIVTEAGELAEDYVGMDDVRNRLNRIIDRATQARKILQQLSRGDVITGVASVGGQPDPVLGGKRVLVADDEELIRQTIADVLLAQGCCVDQASDGAQARQKVTEGRYDLVVTDIKMPGASGYDVFAAARAANPEVRVVMITAFGYDPNHAIVRANAEGLASVLFKPFKVSQLLDCCRTAVAKR